ncbi:unnamed protein product [Trichobilharzia regenti]|nr:unnamed protein product [Trichobilharzia regenti]
MRGIGSRTRTEVYDHHHSHSISRSCSYSPIPPPSRRREYYRGSSSSRSRSPSVPNIPVSKVRRLDADSESYRRRLLPQYVSPRARKRTDSHSRSPRSCGREAPTQWRRPPQASVAHSSVSRRHDQVDSRISSHQGRSPRGGSRTHTASSRHYK